MHLDPSACQLSQVYVLRAESGNAWLQSCCLLGRRPSIAYSIELAENFILLGLACILYRTSEGAYSFINTHAMVRLLERAIYHL